jgi:very-short-patch-repair endonuclease
VRSLGRDETWTLDGIPITSPARTILDLAPRLGPDDLERLIAEACTRSRATRAQLDALLARYPRRPGTPAIASLLAQPHGPAFTRSPPERMLLRLLRDAELPEPRANARLHGYEVDLLWEGLKLVGEFDSQAFHSARPKRERDSLRDQELVRRGYVVIRITWRQLTHDPTALIARIAQTIGRREVELTGP